MDVQWVVLVAFSCILFFLLFFYIYFILYV